MKELLTWNHFIEDEDIGEFYKNIGANYTQHQIQTAIANENEGIETRNKRLLSECISELQPDKFANIILTSEGLGKSKMVFEFIKKFEAERAILLCKSYDQAKDKEKMFKKFYPKEKIAIIKGVDKLLEQYGIDKSLFIWRVDAETKKPYVAFKETVDAAPIKPKLKKKLFTEKQYYDDVMKKVIKVDLVITSEKKFEVEVLINRNFCTDLVIFDEFHNDLFFPVKVIPKTGLPKDIKKMEPVLHNQETWSENYVTKMYQTPDSHMWDTYFEGKIIVLSTEEKANEYFKNNPHANIIDKRTIVFCESNVYIYSVNDKLLNRDNKGKLAFAGWSDNYIVVGNGINSEDNNVTILGKNKHDEWKNQKIMVLATQPSPEETAELMANLPSLSSDDATIMKMADTINQIMGRCCGNRENVKVKEMHVLIPKSKINQILPKLRYLAQVIRTMKNNENPMEVTIHTLTTELLGYKKHYTLYDSTVLSKIEDLIKYVTIHGMKAIKKYTTMKYFKWSKELIQRGKTALEKSIEVLRKTEMYESFIKAPCNIYSDWFNQGELSFTQTKIIDMLRNMIINPVLVYEMEQIR